MTTNRKAPAMFDPKRARELAEALDDYDEDCGFDLGEAAAMLREAAEIVETDKTAILAMGRIVHAAANSSCVGNGAPDCGCAYCLAHRFLRSQLSASSAAKEQTNDDTGESLPAGLGLSRSECTYCGGYGIIVDPHHGHSMKCNRCYVTGKRITPAKEQQ